MVALKSIAANGQNIYEKGINYNASIVIIK